MGKKIKVSKLALHDFLCEFQSPNVSFLNSKWAFKVFHSLMFYLKLTRELLFSIFAGSYCHSCGPLFVLVSSPQYTVFGNWLSTSLGFFMVYGIFLSINISFYIDLSDIWKSQSWDAEYFSYECLLSLVCLKVRESSRCNHYDITAKTSQFVDFSVRPNKTKHPNKRQ